MNDQNFTSTMATVKSVVERYARGEIQLETKEWKHVHNLRYAPSFVPCAFAHGAKYPYTATSIAKSLGWLLPNGNTPLKVFCAVTALQLIEEGKANANTFAGISEFTARARIAVLQGRKPTNTAKTQRLERQKIRREQRAFQSALNIARRSREREREREQSIALVEQARIVRKRLGLTQEQMAKEWGFNLHTIHMWENGHRTPTGIYRKRLEKVLEQIEAGSYVPTSVSEMKVNHNCSTDDLVKRVKALRKKLGLSQIQAAKEWGFSQQAFSSWETGYRNPAGLYRQKLEEILKSDGFYIEPSKTSIASKEAEKLRSMLINVAQSCLELAKLLNV